MQKLVVYQLIRYDHEVTTVDNGKEAIEVLEEATFDLVILDIFMPRLSGIEVLQYIRQERKLNVPIIILSRDNHEEVQQKCFDLGANSFIHKPFHSKEFFLIIKKLTGHTVG